MGVLRSITLGLCATMSACAIKPLRFEDAAIDAQSEDGRIASDADGVDSMDATDVTDAMDSSAPADAAATSDRAVFVEDANGTIGRPSCASEPMREDCRTALIVADRSFCVGTPDAPATATWNASPPLCGLSLSPFRVDAYEVTVARFRPFMQRWIDRTLPSSIDVRFANGASYRAPLPPRATLSEWNPGSLGCTWSDTADAARDQHPLNCVGWSLAMYFCAWDGGHLLTATEYEFVARWHRSSAANGRTYAWGEEAPSCARVHYGPCAGQDGLLTRRVGSLATGAIDAIYDLAGNVAELIADDFAPYATLGASPCWTRSTIDPLCTPTFAGDHHARGSSHMNSSELILHTVFRTLPSTTDPSPSRGFRCAYTTR